MRSFFLLAALTALVSAASLNVQPMVAPAEGASFGIPLNGNPMSYWGTVSANDKVDLTAKLTSSNNGQNVYFRVGFYDCEVMSATSFQLLISGDTNRPISVAHPKSTFDVSSGSLGFTPGNDQNATQTLAITSESLRYLDSAGETWTFTVKQVGGNSICKFFADLIVSGKPLGAATVGKNGNLGPVQDAWAPCCDSTDSAYQVAMDVREHQYMEVVAKTVTGGYETLKLTNPGSLFGLVDTATWPSTTYKGAGVSVRTCLTNSSCGIIADNYYVHLITHGISYYADDAADFHATFTMTTKAGVASASATLAVVVAALFALFH
jgi:hypothetical protein